MNTPTQSKIIGLERYRVAANSAGKEFDITHLALQLQQTLELPPLLQTFCEHTAQIVPCDSVQYKHKDKELEYQTGSVKKHTCHYQLELEDSHLGEIQCTRETPFSIRETELIEKLLSLLIYPLRNALLYQQAVAEAHRDPLTGISNRAAFEEALSRETSSFKRHLTGFSLLLIDIDFFKRINDTYGHIVGDSVLRNVAQSIRCTIRRSDEVFRYGGEEFVVLLGNTDTKGAQFIAERIRKQVKSLEFKINQDIRISASIGVASTRSLSDVHNTLDKADKALYQAKESGRDRVIVSK
ncbi:GGDEF domain-containing protein [Aliikangiella sp. G2MR2-5]|uniref:GGDEF domain-containing protein n=1 Tax=Aliikangiella sp. G2MR2-5 TaxID=2788943 RepID=UPI0018A98764|nr:GGDEF domain-containing protein [Aliikangiella sp. G2MR2-5]